MSEKNKIHKLLEDIEIPAPPKSFIDYHEELGNKRVDTGCAKMPDGYTLMRSFDRVYYYWLKEDGTTGGACSDKWDTRRSAKEDSIKNG